MHQNVSIENKINVFVNLSQSFLFYFNRSMARQSKGKKLFKKLCYVVFYVLSGVINQIFPINS